MFHEYWMPRKNIFHFYGLVSKDGGSWFSRSMRVLNQKLLKACNLSKVYTTEVLNGSMHKRRVNWKAAVFLWIFTCVCFILSLSGHSPI